MRTLAVGVISILLVACSANGQDSYDLVILNGRVLDPETEFDAVRNVGIKGGRIAVITEEDITGADSVDATGHVVTAGFIDTHTHSSDKFSIRMSMMDGVTSGMDLELGALNIGAWYEREAGQWEMNYGTAVSHEMARMIVHDGLELNDAVDATDIFNLRAASSAEDGVPNWSLTVSELDQINAITEILDENLREGALGIGSTPGYASKGISTYEQFEVQRAAARYGRLTGFHTRFHISNRTPTEAQMGFGEVFTNAMLLDAPLLICHNNDYGWWEIEEKLSMARDKGMNMWAEYYPWAGGSGSIGADGYKPETVEGMLGLKYEDMMYDPSQEKYLTKEEYLEIVAVDPGRTVVGFNPARFEWMPYWLKMPHMTVGSDAMWQTTPQARDEDPALFSGHPRTAGTHAKTLRLAREEGVPLNFTLAQLSYWSALHLGDAGIDFFKERGRMQEGMVADVVIFDPEDVAEKATYKAGENGLPPVGMPHVIVNGVFVKRDDKPTGELPGLAIRYLVEIEGRHVPATQEQWLKTFSIDDGSLRRD